MPVCKRCKTAVSWRRKGAKWMCINPDGTAHNDICKQLINARFLSLGEKFTAKTEKETIVGYRIKNESLITERYGIITIGKDYRPIDHRVSCNALPWEDCDCEEVRNEEHENHMREITA